MISNSNWNTSNLFFNTDIEKKMHKIVSSLCYGQEIKLSTDSITEEEEKQMVKALRKSAKFNCIDLKIIKQRNQALIKIQANIF
jgi:hypothetical protein